jgi:hypothetical protein
VKGNSVNNGPDTVWRHAREYAHLVRPAQASSWNLP